MTARLAPVLPTTSTAVSCLVTLTTLSLFSTHLASSLPHEHKYKAFLTLSTISSTWYALMQTQPLRLNIFPGRFSVPIPKRRYGSGAHLQASSVQQHTLLANTRVAKGSWDHDNSSLPNFVSELLHGPSDERLSMRALMQSDDTPQILTLPWLFR